MEGEENVDHSGKHLTPVWKNDWERLKRMGREVEKN